jgi:hypothetical protein
MSDVIVGVAVITWMGIFILSVAVLATDLWEHYRPENREWEDLMEAIDEG